MNKVLTDKKSLEERLDSVQRRCVTLEEEVGKLKGWHLADKQLVKKLQERENLLPSLKSKLVEEKVKFLCEQEELRKLLKAMREQLRQERETRLEAELDVTKAKQGGYSRERHFTTSDVTCVTRSEERVLFVPKTRFSVSQMSSSPVTFCSVSLHV